MHNEIGGLGASSALAIGTWTDSDEEADSVHGSSPERKQRPWENGGGRESFSSHALETPRRGSFNEAIGTPSRHLSFYSDTTSAPASPSGIHTSLRKSSWSQASPSKSQIGSMWSVEMTCLRQAGSTYEAAISLRRIKELLDDIDRSDRIKFCKSDFDAAVASIRGVRGVWSDELSREMVAMTNAYFDLCYFRRLPTSVIQEIMLWIMVDEFAPISSVCIEWSQLGTSDEIWQTFYRHKFLRHNPNSMPESKKAFLTSFRQRLADPQIGDKVEVAWKGKFRLEERDVYQGTAWWVAEVVDKHSKNGKFKIHYPGWESRWDEWVPRNRLRWAVDKNVLCQILAGAEVELWCCGANVPGAWLETKVKKVGRDGRFCLHKVLPAGPLWVFRDRLRLVRRHASEANAGQGIPSRNSPLFSFLPSAIQQRISGPMPSCTIA